LSPQPPPQRIGAQFKCDFKQEPACNIHLTNRLQLVSNVTSAINTETNLESAVCAVSSVCAAFDKMALEKEMLRDFVNLFSLDGDDGDNTESLAQKDLVVNTRAPAASIGAGAAEAGAEAGAGIRVNSSEAEEAGVEACTLLTTNLYPDVEGLYTSVYACGGAYNQVRSLLSQRSPSSCSPSPCPLSRPTPSLFPIILLSLSHLSRLL
jgi:hypothetical protein